MWFHFIGVLTNKEHLRKLSKNYLVLLCCVYLMYVVDIKFRLTLLVCIALGAVILQFTVDEAWQPVEHGWANF